MAKKSADTLAAAERLIFESMSDAELDAILAENPDPEFQAMLETMSVAELEACLAGDTSPLVRRGWTG
jgi:hypothetical protein